MLNIYLKAYNPISSPDEARDRVRSYLSENDLTMHFSTLHKTYYSIVRPVTPILIRQLLQRGVNKSKSCLPNFIWPDFVDHLRSDQSAFDEMTTAIYPPGYRTAIILTHDVETQEGYDFIPKVVELEERYGFVSSWNMVAHKYSLREEVLDLLRSKGHEIGIHGYNHDGTLYYSRRRFLARAKHINAALARHGAIGFRSPQVHRDLVWLQDLAISYDSSCFDYDPYQPFPGGTGCIWPFMAGKFVELPYTVPQDHTLFYVLAATNIAIWLEKTKWLIANNGMILVLTHPDYLRSQFHLAMYEEYLAYLRTIPQAWHCLPGEMARRYHSL